MTETRDDRPFDNTDGAPEGDRPGGWAGVPDALDESPLDDETPGSQGDVESGSEGDFGKRDEPR